MRPAAPETGVAEAYLADVHPAELGDQGLEQRTGRRETITVIAVSQPAVTILLRVVEPRAQDVVLDRPSYVDGLEP